MLRLTAPGLRGNSLPLEPVVPDGLEGAWVLGGTMERSLVNLWSFGVGDLSPIGSPVIYDDFARCIDGTNMFQSMCYDSGPGTWLVAARSVNDVVSIIVGSNAASLPGQYGEAAYYSNAANFRYRRDTDNSGASFFVDVDVANDVSNWTLYLFGNDGNLAYAQNVTAGGVLAQGTITYDPAINLTNAFRFGGDYSAGTIGSIDIGAVWRWNRWLASSAERTAAIAELRLNKPTLAL